jgi:hypothetical protein
MFKAGAREKHIFQKSDVERILLYLAKEGGRAGMGKIRKHMRQAFDLALKSLCAAMTRPPQP